jgi:membrane protease YdiL (CAAX protease family)
MVLLDHLMILVIVVIYPTVGFFSYRRYMRTREATDDRAQLYNAIMYSQWGLCVAALLLWFALARPAADLGITLQAGDGFLIALLLVGIAVSLLAAQAWSVGHASEKRLAAMYAGLGEEKFLLPTNRRELRRFWMLSLTAGVVEEVLWRGYFIWYLGQSLPVWVAGLVAAVVFGLGHAYQGLVNVPKIVLVGGVFAALYILSGSLWLPIILHVVVDVAQGWIGYRLCRRAGATA